MAKTRDFRPALRHFVKVLNSFRGHYYDYDIFRDFIDYVIACLLFEGDKAVADYLKERYKEDYPRFGELFHALVITMNDQLATDEDWFDALGELYEEISSNSKASFLGQFFTPKPVCDMMAQIQGANKSIVGQTVSDPSCGSGRTLIAWHVLAPGNYLVGQDIDAICAKMTAINMALHGCRGQVICGDTLRMSFEFGYEVNPWLQMTGLPHILPINPVQSHNNIERWKAMNSPTPANENEPLPETIVIGKHNQIELAL